MVLFREIMMETGGQTFEWLSLSRVFWKDAEIFTIIIINFEELFPFIAFIIDQHHSLTKYQDKKFFIN